MINWFDMPAEGLSNGGMFEIKELTATENKVYQKDGEVYNKVTVNVEGGGGSSDFSTAEVTITNNSENPALFFGSFIVDNSITHGFNVSENTTETLTVVLYKGVSVMGVDDELNVVVTGDITYSDWDFTITGDGTITIS